MKGQNLVIHQAKYVPSTQLLFASLCYATSLKPNCCLSSPVAIVQQHNNCLRQWHEKDKFVAVVPDANQVPEHRWLLVRSIQRLALAARAR